MEVDVKSVLFHACRDRMVALGLTQGNFVDRLTSEVKEIEALMEFEYFYDLYKKKCKFAKNENNLFFAYLLGLVDDFDIDEPPVYVQGEFPDIDMDYLPVVRDYLKTEWALKEFGVDNVCAIGNYTTFGIKSSLIDMARVHGKDRSEVLKLTTKMGLKDDDGNALTWDKALEQYPDLKKYCEENPDVAEAAKKLLNRNRGTGMHAAGLIISSRPIDTLVPLVRGKDGAHVSAFVEGLHGTDLGPLGLIKFDLLAIINLLQIAKACKIIKERHGIDSICAMPGQSDWSDTAYLNDPAALALANEGKLKCIFQFDSEGIRELVRRGGVDSFDDLAAYSALYRPGPMGLGMHDVYVSRKRGYEQYELHPVLQPILGSTYGVMAFQEQLMKILRVVGNVPDMHCEIVRKAVSKKKIKIFGRYKEMFIKNGQKTLGWTEAQVQGLWDQIEAFADYGFNKSVTKGTLVPTDKGLKKIEDFVPGDIVYSVNEQGETIKSPVVALHNHGIIEGYEVTFDDGYLIICSLDHKFLTPEGQISLRKICRTRSTIYSDPNYRSVDEKYMDDSVRTNCEFSKNDVCSSQVLREMYPNGLEEKTQWRNNSSYGKMWRNFCNLEIARGSFKDLLQMQHCQSRKYSDQNGEVKCRQFVSRKESNFFRDSEEDFFETRNIGCSGETVERMAKKQSREVCRLHRSSLEKFQTIKNGTVVESNFGMGDVENSMWGISQTSGFCERPCLDRNRWSSSFQRDVACEMEQTLEYYSRTGSNAQRRSNFPQEYNFNQSRYGMFQIVKWSNEGRVVPGSNLHAGISDTRNLVSRKIVRVRAVGKRQMYDLEVACPTHNFILPTGIITSNSHSVAYAYISSRLLWLKAHYPLEFFTATLSCEKDATKIKGYRQEAESMGISIGRVTLNKSKVKFDITDDSIYMGFANIKGIGDEVAEKIVANQPYSGFEDFLHRFGTDANVVKALIALRIFEDDEPVQLYEYYEYYKAAHKKFMDAQKRAADNRKRLIIETEAILSPMEEKYTGPEGEEDLSPRNKWLLMFLALKGKMPTKQVTEFEINPKYEKVLTWGAEFDLEEDFHTEMQAAQDAECPWHSISAEDMKALWKAVQKYKRSIANSNKEVIIDPLEGFIPSGVLTADMKELLCEVPQVAESKYYGFSWKHLLESSPDFQGDRAFSDFEEDETVSVRACELHVVERPKRKESKNKKTIYYTVLVEDANSKSQTITFWSDDYDRFKEELEYWENDVRKGNYLSIRLKKPEGGWQSYTFDAPSKQNRWKELPKEKDKDHRIVVMARPTILDETEAFQPMSYPNQLINLGIKVLEV